MGVIAMIRKFLGQRLCKNAGAGAANCGGAAQGRRRSSRRLATCSLGIEQCEPRTLMAADTQRMQVGMNLENIVDWSPAWTFTDVFQASRGWIAQEVNTATGEVTWDVGATNPVRVDANGTPTMLTSRVNGSGQTLRQMAGTLMFRDIDGGYPGGTYRAEWDGTGVVTFGFDAQAIATGRTADGRNFADLQVTPSGNGIFMRIEATSPTDPVRNVNVWMPDWNGQRFAGQRWQPGADFSPFHPLYLERLQPFGTLRFMGMQETNTSDIRTWADRRDANDIRQGSGIEGSPSEPLANGMSVEYMVQLANDLDADAWFNMPHMADDTFVRNFATYVRDHLEPGLKAYVEWSNEIWNFGWGFEASHWVMEQSRLPQNAGLDNWQVAGREAKRDLDIWSSVFSGQTDRLVRVAAGWAANDWVTNRVVESMGGSFDAIAIAPYFNPTDEQRDSYTAATSVDTILADTRAAVTESVGWVRNHRTLADTWATTLGRGIKLVAYEGGPHMDGRGGPYQNAFYAAANDPRMGDIERDYLRALDAEGMDLYVDFQFTGQAGATPWGDFAKLHRMDQPLETAYRYNAVVAAADGSLWSSTPAPALPVVTVSTADGTATEAGREPGTIRFTRTGGDLTAALTVNYTVGGAATAGGDYEQLPGTVTFAAGEATADVTILPIDDAAVERPEGVAVTLAAGPGYTFGSTTRGEVTIASDDVAVVPVVSIASAAVMEGNGGRRLISFTISLSAATTETVTVRWSTANGSAIAGRDYIPASGVATFRPGQRTATANVWVIGDWVREGNETFFVSLSSPSKATLLPTARTATGAIFNDDGLTRAALAAAFASLDAFNARARR
jgi:hypothetical protein